MAAPRTRALHLYRALLRESRRAFAGYGQREMYRRELRLEFERPSMRGLRNVEDWLSSRLTDGELTLRALREERKFVDWRMAPPKPGFRPPEPEVIFVGVVLLYAVWSYVSKPDHDIVMFGGHKRP